MDENTAINGSVELEGAVGFIEGTCYPTHHDYQQAAWTGNGPQLLFCRLCGDVREIKAPTTEVA